MTELSGMTVSQLIEALQLFLKMHGDLPVITADFDTVGDLSFWHWDELDLDICQFMYKDLDRIPLRPYMFELPEEDEHD